MSRVLIIEDDVKTAEAIREGLRADGYDALSTSSGEEAEALLGSDKLDAIVLDWMLPGRDGIDMLRALRARGSPTPVLLLTARDAISDRVMGLDAGADDYLVKPFAYAELAARLRGLLRRLGEREGARRQVGDLLIDIESRRVLRGGRGIALTRRKFELLTYLARHAGETVSRDMLARDVWHDAPRATPLNNVIDVHVAHLRRKIDEGHETKLLHTVRGVGFTLATGR